ncbi:MAG: tripartite tricarboxylate transporter substrate binding protein [Paucimonas sp.]|nr:tripartite tricarboxylate transporter substrate binding protein [Paucimonas sp.]
MNRFLKQVACIAVAALGCASQAAQAQADGNYPNRQVRLLVGFTPGGAVDAAARLMAAELQKATGQTFVVENKPGVGGMLALQEGSRAAPDGYTLMVGSAGPLTVSPTMFKTQKFDPRQSLDPIIWFINTPGIVVVRKDLKANNLKELLALSKSSSLNMASAGSGSVLHLMGEYLQERLGVKWEHVPYKGSTPALTDIAGGRVDVMVDVVPSSAALVKDGKMRALAVTTRQRSPQLPDVPTAAEQGFTGLEMGSWMALLAPKGTPPAIIQRLNAILNESIKKPEIIARANGMGGELVGGTPQALADQINTELPRWAGIIERNGLKGD